MEKNNDIQTGISVLVDARSQLDVLYPFAKMVATWKPDTQTKLDSPAPSLRSFLPIPHAQRHTTDSR